MKVRLCGVLVLLLVAACGQKAGMTEQAKSFEAEIAEIRDAREVEKRCTSVDAEYGSADQDVVSIGGKYPVFMVQGNVTDTSEGAVQIFGRAIVDPSRGLSHWASNGNERNIIVINPKNVIHNPPMLN